MTTVTKSSVVNDLKVLIAISCEHANQLHLFEIFHKMLIRMSYKAVDVKIDYLRKRIYMNVLAEDETYDSVRVNVFAETMSVNLGYSDLQTFLNACMLEDVHSLKQYFPFLMSSFHKQPARTLKVAEIA